MIWAVQHVCRAMNCLLVYFDLFSDDYLQHSWLLKKTKPISASGWNTELFGVGGVLNNSVWFNEILNRSEWCDGTMLKQSRAYVIKTAPAALWRVPSSWTSAPCPSLSWGSPPQTASSAALWNGPSETHIALWTIPSETHIAFWTGPSETHI